MRTHERAILLAFVIVASAAPSRPAGQRPDGPRPSERSWTHPRTPWGDPDLGGVWTTDNNFSIPLERPAAVADKVFLDGKDLEEALAARARTIAAVENGGQVGQVGAGPTHWYETLTARSRRSSLIIDPPNGRLPAFTSAARQRAEAARASSGRGPADSWEDRSLWDRCITVGLPYVMFPTGYNNNVKILQTAGYVTITHEMIHETRIVPLDGRPHVSPAIRQYMGDSRGRWDGNTLVIDVTNFHPSVTTFHPTANFRGSGATLHLIERYTRTGRDQMRYEVTVDDPSTFERPYTAVLDLSPQEGIYEYACHEGNRGLENILSAARSEERAAAPAR
ncbi:MAG: hypothetical protein ABJA98_05200 [Acidobacteriota bacterium]